MKFKENDMVVCVNAPYPSTKVGSTYKVLEAIQNGSDEFIKILNDNGDTIFYDVDFFELAPKFKKGDLVESVECIERSYQEGWPFTFHKAYEVLDTSEDYLVLIDDNGNTASYRDEYFKLFKFKENDRVICKIPTANLTVGETYKVLKELEDIGKSFIKIINDDGDACFYISSQFILASDEPKFKIVIEGYTLDEMLDKIEEAADILNDAVKLEKVYPKLRNLLDDKTLPLDLFLGIKKRNKISV